MAWTFQARSVAFKTIVFIALSVMAGFIPLILAYALARSAAPGLMKRAIGQGSASRPWIARGFLRSTSADRRM